MIKTLIIDDEPEVRDLLNILLRKYPDLEVSGVASNVDDAIELALRIKPDLVLLDIQMPGKDGFTFLDELRKYSLFPGIIFVTAYENYAVRAIRNAAFDYLLKPISKAELFGAIDRFREFLNRNQKSDLNHLVDLLNKTRPGRIRLNTRTGYFFVDPDEIMYIEADGNYSHIKLVNGKTETSTLSLGNLEKMIEAGSFLRISRSYIINMKFISRVDRRSNICELEKNGHTHTIKIPMQKIKLLEGYF